jgi:hypothetical protein
VEAAEARPGELCEIVLKPSRFEDPVPSQPGAPSSVSPPGTPA